MTTKTLAIGLIILAVAAAPLAIAEPGHGRGPHGGFGGGPGMGGPEHRPVGPRGPHGGFGGGPGMGGDRIGHLLGRLGDKLELTETQRTEIEAIAEDAHIEREHSHNAIREAMENLHKAADEGTEAEIVAAGKELADAFTQQALLRSAIRKEIENILTEGQFAQIEEIKAQRKGRAERMHRRRHKARNGDLCPAKEHGRRRHHKPAERD